MNRSPYLLTFVEISLAPRPHSLTFVEIYPAQQDRNIPQKTKNEPESEPAYIFIFRRGSTLPKKSADFFENGNEIFKKVDEIF